MAKFSKAAPSRHLWHEEHASGERVTPGARRRAWLPRLVPNTPLGWALAVLSVLILGAGAYAGSKLVGELFRYGPPGPGGHGAADLTGEQQARGGSGVSYRLFHDAVPGDEGEEVGQSITEDDARVTLEWAYADTQKVVVGFSVQDLKEDRRNAGNHAVLEPIFVNKEDENAPSAPARHSELTDEGGRHFSSINGLSMVPGPGSTLEEIQASKAHSAVFEAPGGLEPSPNHRFRLEMLLREMPVPSSREEAVSGWRVEEKPPIGPLVFDFEIPVRPVPVGEAADR